MKKAPSTLINMFLSLTIIAVVAGAVLAVVYGMTKESIVKVEQNKVQQAISEVLTQKKDADGNDSIKIEFDKIADTVIYIGKKNEKGQYADSVVCHIAYFQEHYAGAAVESSDPDGFGGYFKVMVGFDADGNVYGYQVLKSNETPGLGAKAAEWFQKYNRGDIIGKSPASELKVKKDNGDVDAITGSTITSRAFLRSVNKAYACLQTALNNITPVVETSEAATEELAETESQPK
jgi:electron transport complex protein RnfG